MTHPRSGRLSRRRLAKGVAATGLAAASASHIARSGGARQSGTPVAGWSRFDADIHAAMDTFHIVGGAVAVVDTDGILHSTTFGVRNLASGEPVTPDTHFLVASTTKSMTALLLATFVDDGVFAWDQPVKEVWPDFRAPTEELTNTLRVRDLLGMASGLGEDVAVSAFHQGDVTTAELLRSLAALPITDPPNTTFFYNGTVYAAGGYLPALAQGAAADDLGTVYARLMMERVYRPSGMASSRITDDPRPFVENYATGYAPDFTAGTAAEPYAPVGSFAPAGGTLSTLTDMANYVTMQLNEGVATTGQRVVSAANLAECWKPQVTVPTPPSAEQPDLMSAQYGMGWLEYAFRGGRRFFGHAGGIDGFTTFIGFFPEDGLGLVVLTNMGPFPRGLAFAPVYVTNLLLEDRFGLNAGANAAVIANAQAAEQHLVDLAAQAAPVDPATIAPYLGSYERGWRAALDADGELRLHQSARALRLLAMPDGSYVMAGGVLPGTAVRFFRDDEDMPWMEIEDLETVRWMVGPDAVSDLVAPPAA
jgi:CubicO group peptidase (beta-lactamase class C family)